MDWLVSRSAPELAMIVMATVFLGVGLGAVVAIILDKKRTGEVKKKEKLPQQQQRRPARFQQAVPLSEHNGPATKERTQPAVQPREPNPRHATVSGTFSVPVPVGDGKRVELKTPPPARSRTTLARELGKCIPGLMNKKPTPPIPPPTIEIPEDAIKVLDDEGE